MNVNTIKVVGTTYGVRQFRIAELRENAPVRFKAEPGNTYDPLAIAVVNENGEHLGYIGRDDPQRERIRVAMNNGFVIARAQVVGGFRKRDGSLASLGLRVQWYAVSAMYGFHDKEEEPDVPVEQRRSNGPQKRKSYEISCKYKGKDARRRIDLRNIERESPERMKRENRTRRQAFKRGEDIKSSQLGWHYGAYITEAEALELFKERRAG